MHFFVKLETNQYKLLVLIQYIKSLFCKQFRLNYSWNIYTNIVYLEIYWAVNLLLWNINQIERKRGRGSRKSVCHNYFQRLLVFHGKMHLICLKSIILAVNHCVALLCYVLRGVVCMEETLFKPIKLTWLW